MPPRPWAPSADRKALSLEEALLVREPDEKAMQAIQAALSDPEMDAETVGLCAEKLSEWLRRQTTSTQKLIAQCRLNPVVVQVLKLHGGDLEVARHCCRIIYGIANRSGEGMASLCRAGVVVGLNTILDLHPSDPEVLEAGTQALEILAARGGARDIVATGGLARLLNIVLQQPDNSYVRRACFSCLDQAVCNCGPLTEAMREEVAGAADLAAKVAQSLAKGKGPVDGATKRRAEKLAVYIQTCAREQKRHVLATKTKETEREAAVEEAKAPEQEDLDLRVWLSGMDRSGALAQYHGVLAQNFDSVPHVIEAYSEDGRLDPQFFEDLGITKLGHRRKFEQWFQRHFEENVVA